MPVGERQVLLPVIGHHVLLSGADSVADEVADRMIGGRHVLRTQASPAKKLAHRLRVLGSQELAARIGPQVLRGAGDSWVMRGEQSAKRTTVPLQNVEELLLVATEAGDGINCDYPDWAGARLIGNP